MPHEEQRSIRLEVAHPGSAAAAGYVVRLFAHTHGFSVTESPDADVVLLYGRSNGAATNQAVRVHVPMPMLGADGNGTQMPSAAMDFRALLRAAAPGDLREFVTNEGRRELTLELDIIAAAFWCLTRAEERATADESDAHLLSDRVDLHGRFPAEFSHAPLEFYEIPVVNRWFENLSALIRERLGLPVESPQEQQTIALTHDVDLLHKYRGLAGLGRSVGRVLKNPGAGLNDLKAATAVNFSGRRDPYDSFDDLYGIKERISAHSTFFMMTKSGGEHDCDYRLEDPAVRSLMLRARTFGDEIGVHPSWNSGTSAEMIAREVKAVEAANGQSVRGSRQHYLRFHAPHTWRHLAAAGVRYDSSLGFPDRAGFRCGWSGAFRPFDTDTMQELPILEIPLVCMDITLAAYEKIPAELCLERLTNLLDASCDHIRGGALVFLWHNSIADRDTFKGYWDTFEYFFSIASGSARFVTLNQLCDEYEQPGRSF
ncbi:MAG: polysaccharide deacetylase family protein [Candidatus Sumerlaeaceae bacterium]